MAWNMNAVRKTDENIEQEKIESGPRLEMSVDPGEQAIETVGVFLRNMGQFSFDVLEDDAEVIAEKFDLWQKHLLMGLPRPGADPDPQPLPMDRRDWPGVRQFFAHHRRSEKRYVDTSMTDMKRVIWALINGLNRAVSQDSQIDKDVLTELTRLQAMVQSASLVDIKREVLSAVSKIGSAIEDRQKEQQEYIRQLGRQLESMSDQLREARAESTLDPLTRLHNRKAFDDYLAHTLELFSLFSYPACLMLVDVDHFKTINDRMGHPAGDAVLRVLSDRLGRTFVMKGDFVARYGGEEFAIVLRQADADAGRAMAERLLADVRGLRIPIEGQEIDLTISIGLAPVSPGDSVQTWIARADSALYEAKRTGRDRIVATKHQPNASVSRA